MKLLKKLSMRHICGNFPAPAIGETKELAIIIGYTNESETKPTAFGDSTRFIGDFKGVNTETGEEFRASSCYLPDIASGMLESALDSSGGNAVEFGFRILAVGVAARKEGEGNKYEYRVEPLMQAAENDPLALLSAKIGKGLAALPAPTPKAAPSPAKAGKGKGK